MEQETKNCPYCGEEIMATAKKCKHCGEWLVKVTNEPVQQASVIKESYFSPEFLYDNIWTKILFGVTILGSLIIEVQSLGLSSRNHWIHFIADMPEWLGALLRFGGEGLFLFLLMKTMSHFHKPLKGIFLWNIVWYIGLGLLFAMLTSLVGEDTDGEDSVGLGVMIIMICVLYLPMIVLGAKIIGNYEDSIQKLGKVILIYIGISILIGAIECVVSEGIKMFLSLLTILIDVFYFGYLRDALSK